MNVVFRFFLVKFFNTLYDREFNVLKVIVVLSFTELDWEVLNNEI